MADTLVSNVLGAPVEPSLLKGSKEWDWHRPAKDIDDKDAGTPDSWIPRNPSVLRLTGRHPLNCEPPMDQLMDAGFVTPVSLHLVRNHGAVPKLDWNSHRVEITGLVDRPMSLTMDEILKFPTVTVPVTVTCAGNRRKEENMTKKSIGFSWGPTATSCTYWTGVRLCDVLRHVGTKGPREGANYVCFRGPKGELPKGDDGSYGTSLDLGYAMNPSNDVLLAFKQNERWLTPDHGYPIRMIIPGFIGGRMVKWLSEITVTKNESNNFYHYHDNRVLPPHVDETLAKEEGWWFKPDYIINELNVNSAVARPWHDETVSLKRNSPYTVKGYAYSGGGRRVIRVEVSTDAGTTWRQADIKRMEDNNGYGKCWTWVFWELQLRVKDFLDSDQLLVRAVDSAHNVQPDHITWNVMGMMNNCHFKIITHRETTESGDMYIRFQHPAPTEVGELGNAGWREEANLPKSESAPVKPVKPVSRRKMISMEEVAKHNTEKSCWFVHEGKVYDATSYLEEHPGGAESILIEAGGDATIEFNSIHSPAAKRILSQYYIGDLDAKAKSKSTTGVAQRDADLGLNPKKKIKFPLIEKIELSQNVRLFRFGLQTPQTKLGLPVGQHMFLYADIEGEPCMRAYTPTSSDDDLGHFDLVVKVYRANEHPKFPEGGKMSQFLDRMEIGDTIDVKGPVGHFTYSGCGSFVKNRKVGNATQLSMIAGGTGITPMYQVIKAILKNPEDKTQIKLLYANRTVDDILLYDELETLAAQHENFDIWYTLDIPPEKWGYSSGFINREMLELSMFPESKDGLVLLCGPKPMIDYACIPNLRKLGWEKLQMVEF